MMMVCRLCLSKNFIIVFTICWSITFCNISEILLIVQLDSDPQFYKRFMSNDYLFRFSSGWFIIFRNNTDSRKLLVT